MKTKILVLLLLAFSSVSIAQTTVANKLKINGNTTSTTAPFVAVIENNGEVNKITKVDLIDAIFVNTASDFNTLIGNTTKLYVTRDGNKIYRFDGTIYRPLAETEISGKENLSNKSDSFTASSSTTYASTKALVDGIAQNDGTNVKTSGDQTISGSKTFIGNTTSQAFSVGIGALYFGAENGGYNPSIPSIFRTNNKLAFNLVPDGKLLVFDNSLYTADRTITLPNKNGTLATLSDIPAATDISNKVDKVTGKSLILDTEITRLGTLANYTHPTNHPPSIITQDASNRFVSDTEKAIWNSKQSVLVSGTNIKTVNGNSILGSGNLVVSGGSTINTAFTQKTFAASMSVAHDAANPNFFVNITGNFSLAITGTVNGDSGIVNLNFAGTQVATLTATVNKVITGASALVQVYFIHDSQGLKWYRDEINGNLQNAIDAGSVAVKNGDISFESNNSAGGISRVSTTTNRVALENSNAQSQLGSSIASTFGILSLTQGDFTKDKTTTVTVGVSNVNTQISFEGKTIAGDYVVKTRPLNSYTVATLPAAVLNDEATVTDATSAATLTGGGSLTIPVWYNGTAWTKLGGGSGGGTVDTSNLAVQDGTVLYHTLKRFTPTGTVSSSGTTVTSVGTQFASSMVGAKLTINGETRIITAFTSSTVVTVASAYSTNYSDVLAADWGVYNVAIFVDANGGMRLFTNTGSTILFASNNANSIVTPNLTGFADVWLLGVNGMKLRSSGVLQTSATSSTNDASDIGLRRNAAGIYEVYDGVTATGLEANRRDLLVRNLISKSNFYASDAAADADTALPSGAFYKITGSRGVNQKP